LASFAGERRTAAASRRSRWRRNLPIVLQGRSSLIANKYKIGKAGIIVFWEKHFID